MLLGYKRSAVLRRECFGIGQLHRGNYSGDLNSVENRSAGTDLHLGVSHSNNL